jgi:hypothetical protein
MKIIFFVFTAFISETEKSRFCKIKTFLIFSFWTFLKMSFFQIFIDFFFQKLDDSRPLTMNSIIHLK